MEKREEIFRILANIRNIVANNYMMANYYNDDKSYRLTDIKETVNDLRKQVDELDFELDVSILSREQLMSLDFGKWDEESDLMLLPLWVKPFVKDIEVTSINGDKLLLSETDNDVRFGCIAFGVESK
jgi:hypothetical protein